MQLDDMLKRCEHFLKDQYAMTAMNGMGHVEKLLKYFPKEKVVAGTALVATILTKPGEVEFVGERGWERLIGLIILKSLMRRHKR